MFNLILETGIGVLTATFATLAIYWARPLGGIVYAIPPLIAVSNVRWISAVIGWLLHGPIYASFLFKAIGYAVSSSGVIIFLVVTHVTLPNIERYPGFYWGVLLACLESTLHIMHRIHLMQIHSFTEIIDLILGNKRLGPMLSQLSVRERMRLARGHYTDQSMIDLLLIVVSYGAIIFCTAMISGTAAGPALPNLGDAIEKTLTFLRFLAVSANPFLPGDFKNHIIAVFYGLCLLHFLTFYISLSSKLIDEDIRDESVMQSGDHVIVGQFTHDFEMSLRYALAQLEKSKKPNPPAPSIDEG